MKLINPERIKLALAMFTRSSLRGEDELRTRFERLSAGIRERVCAGQIASGTSEALQKLQRVNKAFNYTLFRLQDIFFRLSQMKWMQNEFLGEKTQSISYWHIYAGLTIKDFHADVFSYMDSIAPLLIQTYDKLKKVDQEKLPGFWSIQKDTTRSYREKLPEKVKNLIDACERWWGFVKDVRNILLHREHERLVFGYPHDGILFQVYEGSISPKIIDGSLLWTQGHNVVDFELYSGFVVGELILFLDELSSGIAEKLEIRDEATPEAIRSGDFSTLIVSMERLSMVEGSGK